jgi:hypothetical protein
VQVLGAGGALGGPAHTGVNFGGKKTNLGAAPYEWGFAKKGLQSKTYCATASQKAISSRRKKQWLQ